MTFSGWNYFLPALVLALAGFAVFFLTMVRLGAWVGRHRYGSGGIAGLLLLDVAVIAVSTLFLYRATAPFAGVLEIGTTGTRWAGGQVTAAEPLGNHLPGMGGGKLCPALRVTLDNGQQYTALSAADPRPGDWVRLEYSPQDHVVLFYERCTEEVSRATVTEPELTAEEVLAAKTQARQDRDAASSPVISIFGGCFFVLVILNILDARAFPGVLDQWLTDRDSREPQLRPRWAGALEWYIFALPMAVSLGSILVHGSWGALYVPALAAVPFLFSFLSTNTCRLDYNTSRIRLYRRGKETVYPIRNVRSCRWESRTAHPVLTLTFQNGDKASFPLRTYTGTRTMYEYLKKHPYLQDRQS